MASSTTAAAAALACLLPASLASRLPKAASFAPLPAHSAAWRRGAVSVAAPRRRRSAPGVAYATAATEKSIYDFTVKVTRSRLLNFVIIVNGAFSVVSYYLTACEAPPCAIDG
jgi:hypothetical protein